jgi:hypothetical protein
VVIPRVTTWQVGERQAFVDWIDDEGAVLMTVGVYAETDDRLRVIEIVRAQSARVVAEFTVPDRPLMTAAQVAAE